MATVTKGTKFPAQLVTEMFNAVKGHSSIAKMAASEPIPFVGKDIFVFNMDSDVAIVGESGAKPAGGATVSPVQIRPVKIVYQSRVSDEFLYAAEETRMQYLRDFAEGFTKKLAAGLDKMAIHGIDPSTGNASTVIGNNHLDYVIDNYNSGSNVVEFDASTDAPDAVIDEAIDLVEEPNGVILSKTMRGKIAAMETEAGGRKYPEFAWGATPNELGGMALDSNSTMGSDLAIVGDWSAFKWGFAKELPLEVIEYGNPDGGTYDLKRANEVLLRSEAFIGWGILNAADFAKIEPSS